MRILAGDIGGTKTLLQIAEVELTLGLHVRRYDRLATVVGDSDGSPR